jgi:pimeloyl-ACP methyl ester carboxylesterase
MRDRWLRRAALAGCGALVLAGCNILGLREQQEKAQGFARLGGWVATGEPGTASQLVVLLFQGDLARRESLVLRDYFVREHPGRWGFVVAPGEYLVAAFEDRNADLVYDDEPLLGPSGDLVFRVDAGEREEDLQLVIPPQGRAQRQGAVDVRALQLASRSASEQAARTLADYTVLGEVTTFDNGKFTPEAAEMGLWRRVDFILSMGPGIYFLEPYDPERIPVLFVHGISGHPRQFEAIVEHLDRGRFQPWLFFYPSGSGLGELGRFLAELVAKLRARHGFDRLFVVAHSMGGLVSRAFILEYEEAIGGDEVALVLTISSPFGGDERAAEGVAEAPKDFPLAPSWIDVAAGSPFLDSLFYRDPGTRRVRRQLPARVAYHLLYGYENAGNGPSGDSVVPLSSVLRPEVQAEARTWRAVDATHTGILQREETFEFVNERLAEAAR